MQFIEYALIPEKPSGFRPVPGLILALVILVSGRTAESFELPGPLRGWGGTKSGVELPETIAQIGPIEATAAVALVEGIALGNAWLAREIPIPYGVGMIVLSPFASIKGLNRWGNAALLAGVAGLGLYDALNHSQDSRPRKERFWINYAAIHLIILPAYGVDYLTGGKGKAAVSRVSSSIDVDPSRGFLLVTTRY